ncbi:neuronal pentraxin-1-like protein [Cricetulus griseus]|nr:neuronal pentraxin-1-like protein [Cricetulus griseus]
MMPTECKLSASTVSASLLPCYLPSSIMVEDSPSETLPMDASRSLSSLQPPGKCPKRVILPGGYNATLRVSGERLQFQVFIVTRFPSYPCYGKAENLPPWSKLDFPLRSEPGQKDNRPGDKFQLTFPLRTNYMYAKVKKSLPEMYAFTVCMWLKSSAAPGVGTPFSYAVPGQANELVLIEWGNNPMEILINDKSRVMPWTSGYAIIPPQQGSNPTIGSLSCDPFDAGNRGMIEETGPVSA